jgi:hypothetical protein
MFYSEVFIEILNNMRLGGPSTEAIQLFQGVSHSIPYANGIEPTDLYVASLPRLFFC